MGRIGSGKFEGRLEDKCIHRAVSQFDDIEFNRTLRNFRLGISGNFHQADKSAKTHHAEKHTVSNENYPCTYCGKSFSIRRRLLGHCAHAQDAWPKPASPSSSPPTWAPDPWRRCSTFLRACSTWRPCNPRRTKSEQRHPSQLPRLRPSCSSGANQRLKPTPLDLDGKVLSC